MSEKVIKRSSITGITYEEVLVNSPDDQTNLKSSATEPTSPTPLDGDMFLDTAVNAIKARISGAWQQLVTLTTALGGDVSGTIGAVSVNKWKGVSITGTPSAGQVPTAIDATHASWQTQTGGGGGDGGGTTIATKVRCTTATAVSNGVAAIIPFDSSPDYDTDGFFDPLTDNTKLVVPTGKGGIYSVSAWVIWDAPTSSPRIGLQVFVNGSRVFNNEISTTADPYPSFTIGTDLLLNDGDEITLLGYQATGITRYVTVATLALHLC